MQLEESFDDQVSQEVALVQEISATLERLPVERRNGRNWLFGLRTFVDVGLGEHLYLLAGLFWVKLNDRLLETLRDRTRTLPSLTLEASLELGLEQLERGDSTSVVLICIESLVLTRQPCAY